MTLDAAIWGAELAAEQYDIDGILNLQLHEITSHNRLSIEMQRRFLPDLIDVDAGQQVSTNELLDTSRLRHLAALRRRCMKPDQNFTNPAGAFICINA